MFQRTEILGNLGKDPELKTNAQGKQFCQLSVAVTKKWKNDKGEQQEKTTWFNVHVRENQAPSVAKYLRKGHQVHVVAEYDSWSTEKDGKKDYFHMFKAESVTFLRGNTINNQQQQGGNNAGSNFAADDIPF